MLSKVIIVEPQEVSNHADGGSQAILDLVTALKTYGHSVEIAALGKVPDKADWVRELNRDDLIVISSRPGAGVLTSADGLTKPVKIYFGHDIHHQRFKAWGDIGGVDRPKPRDIALMRALEVRCWHSHDVTLYPNPEEIKTVEAESGYNRGVYYPYFTVPYLPCLPNGRSRRTQLIFIGGAAHAPNRDGLSWVVRHLWPTLYSRSPTLSLKVIGEWPPSERAALKGVEGIEFCGVLSDQEIRCLCQPNDIAIAPIRFGAGIKRKVLHYLSLSLRVLGTPEAFWGLPTPWPKNTMVEAPLDAWEASLSKLLAEPHSDSVTIEPYLERHFSLEFGLKQWEYVLSVAIAHRQQRWAHTKQ